jgi:sialate O-acetylesterase
MKKHLFVASLVAACAGYANVTVPAIFSDNAVLQTSPSTAVFGKADPGEKVSVSYGSAKADAVAGKDGKWLVRLDLSKDDGAGKNLVISGKNTITCKNVITGEVWFCIGQSNMAMTVGRSLDAKENVAKSANDRIRRS